MKIKKYLIIILSLFWIQILNANLSLNTTYLMFEDNTNAQSIIITNNSNKDSWYEASFIYFTQLKDGKYIKDNNHSKIAEQYLSINPKKIFIKSKKSQQLIINKAPTKSLTVQEFNLHLLIKEVNNQDKDTSNNPNNLAITIEPNFGISIPLILRIGNINSTTHIRSAKITKINKDIFLNTTIYRKGQASSRVNLALISSQNGSDNVIARIDGINILLSTNSRDLILNLGSLDNLDLKNKLSKSLVLQLIDPNTKNIIDSFNVAYK